MIPVHGYTPPDLRHSGWHHPHYSTLLSLRYCFTVSRAQSNGNTNAGVGNRNAGSITHADRRLNPSAAVYCFADSPRYAHSAIHGHCFHHTDTDRYANHYVDADLYTDRDTYGNSNGHTNRDTDRHPHRNANRYTFAHGD